MSEREEYTAPQNPGQQPEPSSKWEFGSLFGGDRPLWVVILVLGIFSLLVIYSSTASMAYRRAGGDTSYFFFSQLKYMLLSFAIMVGVHRLNYQHYVKLNGFLFVFSLGCMLLTFVMGVTLNSAARWVVVPVLNITFQPSDFLRVTLVVYLAQQLAKRQAIIDRLKILPALNFSAWSQNPKKNRDILFNTTLPLLGPVVLSCGLILSSNFSTAAITFLTCLVMLFIGRVRVRELFRLVGLALVSVSLIVALMFTFGIGRAQTWVHRLTDFVGIEQVDSQSEGGSSQEDAQEDHQKRQAQIAIASGLFPLGKGPGNSTQRSQLPHAYSDFAYAFIIEEYGVVGGVFVLLLYLWLFFRSIVIFQRCGTALPSFLVLGLSLMITLQAVVNMMVSVGYLPVTGQTLPLISLGGSSLLFTSIALGLILGVSRQMKEQTIDKPRGESLIE